MRRLARRIPIYEMMVVTTLAAGMPAAWLADVDARLLAALKRRKDSTP